jgi:hypothetical protein
VVSITGVPSAIWEIPKLHGSLDGKIIGKYDVVPNKMEGSMEQSSINDL